MFRTAIAIAAALCLGACSTMSKEDCAAADWTSIGERDGIYGEDRGKFEERRAQCAKYGLASSAEDYDRGRERGIRSYCTPEAGFDAGRNGRPYRGVCPPEAEQAFLAEYRIGKELYDLTTEVKELQDSYDGVRRSLDDQHERADRARDRLRDEALSDEERSEAQRDLEKARREMDRLRDELDRLEADIRRAEGRLDDYRQFIARRSRS